MGYRPGAGTGKAIGEALKKNKTLTKLNLMGNNIKGEGEEALIGGLRYNLSLTFLLLDEDGSSYSQLIFNNFTKINIIVAQEISKFCELNLKKIKFSLADKKENFYKNLKENVLEDSYNSPSLKTKIATIKSVMEFLQLNHDNVNELNKEVKNKLWKKIGSNEELKVAVESELQSEEMWALQEQKITKERYFDMKLPQIKAEFENLPTISCLKGGIGLASTSWYFYNMFRIYILGWKEDNEGAAKAQNEKITSDKVESKDTGNIENTEVTDTLFDFGDLPPEIGCLIFQHLFPFWLSKERNENNNETNANTEAGALDNNDSFNEE